jgi:autotransporter family porin
LVLHEGLVKNWLLEPHAQLGYTWSDSHNFKLGTQGEVSNVNGDGVQMRLGARFYGQSTKEGYRVLPFIEANCLYDSSSPEAKINGKHVESDMSKNCIELKVGVNGNLTKSLSSYAQLDSRFGSNNYRQLGVQIGLNYSF